MRPVRARFGEQIDVVGDRLDAGIGAAAEAVGVDEEGHHEYPAEGFGESADAR